MIFIAQAIVHLRLHQYFSFLESLSLGSLLTITKGGVAMNRPLKAFTDSVKKNAPDINEKKRALSEQYISTILSMQMKKTNYMS